MKTLFGENWVGWLNLIVLQWFFVRLFYSMNDAGQIEHYGLFFPIVPLTGWRSDYIPSNFKKIQF